MKLVYPHMTQRKTAGANRPPQRFEDRPVEPVPHKRKQRQFRCFIESGYTVTLGFWVGFSRTPCMCKLRLLKFGSKPSSLCRQETETVNDEMIQWTTNSTVKWLQRWMINDCITDCWWCEQMIEWYNLQRWKDIMIEWLHDMVQARMVKCRNLRWNPGNYYHEASSPILAYWW